MKFIDRGYEIFWDGKLERIFLGSRTEAENFCKDRTLLNKGLGIEMEITVGESIPVYSRDEFEYGIR